MRTGRTASVVSAASQAAVAAAIETHTPRMSRAVDRELRRMVRQVIEAWVASTRVHTARGNAGGFVQHPSDWEPPSYHVPVVSAVVDAAEVNGNLQDVTAKYREATTRDTGQAIGEALAVKFDVSNKLLDGVIASQSGMKITTAPTEVVDKMMTSLQESYDRGDSITDAAREMRQVGYAESKGFAERIARTEVVSASNAASLAMVKGGTDISLKIWMATGDDRTRDDHADADGQTVPIDAPFEVGGEELDYPGDDNGSEEQTINCLPGWVEVQTAGLRAVTRRWYEGDLVTLRFASGNELAGTPNHPVLSVTGEWLALGSVEEGDDLVGARLVRDDTGAPDPERPPTEIAEVYRLAHVAGDAQRVGGSPPDFHGDGQDGQVDVVAVDGRLLIDAEAATDEQVTQLGLALADAARAARGNADGSAVAELASLPEYERAASSRVRRAGEVLAPAGIHVGHTRGVGLAEVAKLDPGLLKPARDRGTADAEVSGEREHAGAVAVSSEQVVAVDRHSFSGHVYNLDSGSGWYTGNSVAQRNCRCTLGYAEGPPSEVDSGDTSAALDEAAVEAAASETWGADAADLELRAEEAIEAAVELRDVLPPDAKEALDAYYSPRGILINQMLRGDIVESEVADLSQHANRLLKMVKPDSKAEHVILGRDTVAFRAARHMMPDMLGLENYEKAFTSATTDTVKMEHLALHTDSERIVDLLNPRPEPGDPHSIYPAPEGVVENTDIAVVLRLHVPAGVRYLAGAPQRLAFAAGASSQSEIVFAPGLRYVIIGEAAEQVAGPVTYDALVLRDGETALARLTTLAAAT